jgi:hypothetical protein
VALQVALADVTEEHPEAGGFIEEARLQNGIHFGTFLLQSRGDVHGERFRPAREYIRIACNAVETKGVLQVTAAVSEW